MTSIMTMDEDGVDPQAEVRKLQDLVKKLETQNEVLRSKQKLGSDSNVNGEPEFSKQSVNNSVFYNTRKHSDRKESVTNDTLETVDLIDIDKSIDGTEENWLYSSPRPPTPQQNRVSPYKWVRQDLDNPCADMSARKSLKYKLDEVARISRSSSTPAFQNYSTPPRGSQVAMSLSADSTPSPRIMAPSSRPSAMMNSRLQGSKLNTGTFTRPKKKDKPSPDSNGDDMKENVEAVHHPNVADIENLAKLQEESLRQSIAQTSPRRGFRSRPLPNVSNDNDHSVLRRRDSESPARFEEGMNRRNSQSNNSVGSDNSTPPDSPYGSSQQLHTPNSGGSNLRGSLPNVSRLMPRAQHHNSDSSLADCQGEESYSPPPEQQTRYTSRLQKLPRPSSPSVSGLKQPQPVRGPSPQRTGLPTPARRTIPRPGSAGTPRSGMSTPRRISGLPGPPAVRNGGQNQQRLDDSWREGCF